MPELPEVENVKLSLLHMGAVGLQFSKVELRRKDLRVPFPIGLAKKLRGQTVLSVQRRAKYLLFETEKYFLLSHLGMSGSWRALGVDDRRKHDHVLMQFSNGLTLALNDPRRFGVLDLILRDRLEDNRWLQHLGVEPLGEGWTREHFFNATRKIKAPIKSFLMDQRRVVGVGNIYASEALYLAKVRPQRAAGKVTRLEASLIVTQVQSILWNAIHAGGSTIKDYRNSNGESGRFQNQFKVYGRVGLACTMCASTIRAERLSGRNTYWCPTCQR